MANYIAVDGGTTNTRISLVQEGKVTRLKSNDRLLASPLFAGIASEERCSVLDCIGYHIANYKKGDIIAFEQENIRHIGIVLEGSVDTVKEDLWGNKSLLMRIHETDMFGETFACGSDNTSVVTYVASRDAQVMFIPFERSLRTCANACAFHQKMTRNMVSIIADKNRDLMRKLEIVSKRTIREKILAYLSMQAQAQNTRYFHVPFGRVEWAEYLCVDRSALSRELAKMQAEGLIDFDRNCFRIL